jgi:hypothetical protein
MIELRCDRDPQRMFGKLLNTSPVRVDPGTNLMEFSCDKCRRATGAKLVLHRFNILGELVETETRL